jgi:hypothetical protein
MKLTDQQITHLKSMRNLLDEYLNDKINFSYLVNSLEGILDVADISDKNLINNWYEHWTPLEIINAETEFVVEDKEKKKNVTRMKKFLEDVLNNENK